MHDRFNLMQESVPKDTMLVYHTLHFPQKVEFEGWWEADPFLEQHVAQLNAAGRQCATEAGFNVIDYEAMSRQISKRTLLVDTSHLGPCFTFQVMPQS